MEAKHLGPNALVFKVTVLIQGAHLLTIDITSLVSILWIISTFSLPHQTSRTTYPLDLVKHNTSYDHVEIDLIGQSQNNRLPLIKTAATDARDKTNGNNDKTSRDCEEQIYIVGADPH